MFKLGAEHMHKRDIRVCERECCWGCGGGLEEHVCACMQSRGYLWEGAAPLGLETCIPHTPGRKTRGHMF